MGRIRLYSWVGSGFSEGVGSSFSDGSDPGFFSSDGSDPVFFSSDWSDQALLMGWIRFF